MAFSGYMTCIDDDLQVFTAMAPPHIGFEPDPVESSFHIQPPTKTASPPEVYAAEVEVECVDERRLRRRISNRESARRSRARKQRNLDELRDSAALLERWNRELAARAQAAHGRLALLRLANAGLRTEAAGLSRRLAAARRALALDRLYAATAIADSSNEQWRMQHQAHIEQTIASLIA